MHERFARACCVKPAQSAQNTGWGPVIASSAVMSVALLGDALIYAVLPLHAATFGISLAWVGILLSANRIIRVLAYGAIARLTHRVGARGMCIASVAGACLSTTLYGVAEGPWWLLFARLLWGITFATLVLVTLAYAVENRAQAGTRVGVSHSIWSIGPMLALFGGTWLVALLGPREIFVYLGVVGLVALPFALSLTRVQAPAPTPPPKLSRPWFRPNAIEAIAFIVGVTADGLFAFSATLMLAERLPAATAVVVGGALLAMRDVGQATCAPIAGYLGDRFGPRPVFAITLLVSAMGLALIGWGWLVTGAVIMLLAKAGAMTLAPAVIVRGTPDTQSAMPALARMQASRDLGAAVGPFTAGFLVAVISPQVLHLWAAALLVLALCWWLREAPRKNDSRNC